LTFVFIVFIHVILGGKTSPNCLKSNGSENALLSAIFSVEY